MHNQPGVQPLSDAADASRYLVAGARQTEPPLPSAYAKNQVTLLVRDPHWIYAFWECHAADGRLDLYRTDPSSTVRDLVATFPVTGTGSRYLHVPHAAGHYIAGLTASGLPTLMSALVQTPPDAPSDLYDEAWMSIDALQYWLRQRTLASSPGITPLVLPEHH